MDNVFEISSAKLFENTKNYSWNNFILLVGVVNIFIMDIYLRLPPDRIWPKVFLYSEDFREEGGRSRAEIRALLDYVSYRLTLCNESQMTLLYLDSQNVT